MDWRLLSTCFGSLDSDADLQPHKWWDSSIHLALSIHLEIKLCYCMGVIRSRMDSKEIIVAGNNDLAQYYGSLAPPFCDIGRPEATG